LAREECLSKYLKQQESGNDAEGLQFVEKNKKIHKNLKASKFGFD
jgi:hypothetical protein